MEAAITFIAGTWFLIEGNKYLPKQSPPGTEVLVLTAVATIWSVLFGYHSTIVGKIPSMDPDAGIAIGSFRLPIELLNVGKLITEVPLVDRFGGSYLVLCIKAALFAGKFC
jgi:hypothetical protein